MLPRNYAIPRSGEIVGITATTPDELRAVRSELELLRRVGECARRRELAACSVRSPRFSDRDRGELAVILRDATHPLVGSMIEQMDNAFPEIREDLPMSAVKKEAEQLVREMEESGVLDDASVDPDAAGQVATANPAPGTHAGSCDRDATPPPSFGDEATLMSALDRAAADMATLVGEYAAPPADPALECKGPTPSDSAAAQRTGLESSEALACPVSAATTDLPTFPSAPSGPGTESAVSIAPTGDTRSAEPTVPLQPSPDTESGLAAEDPAPMVDQTPVAEPAAHLDAAFVPDDPADAVEPLVPPACVEPCGVPSTKPDSCRESSVPPASGQHAHHPVPAERLLQAVNEVESGVQRIARLISDEVRTQSLQAVALAADLAKRREEFEKSLVEAENIVRELRALRDQGLADRAEVEACRREASALREGARSAKQRAERAADSAESAAEQILMDAAAARHCTTTAP